MRHSFKISVPLMLLTLLLFIPVFFTPAQAQAQDGFRPISPELFDAIEEWSSPRASLESVALEDHPDAIHAYAGAVEDHYGLPLDEALAGEYPDAVELYGELVPSAAQSSADLMAFLMSHERDTYEEWQYALDGELTFAGFVDRHLPGLAADTETRAVSHAAAGQSLVDFLTEKERHDLLEETDQLLGSIPLNPGDECACTTLVTSARRPATWETYVDENNVDHEDPWWKTPRKVKKVNYTAGARGAAKNIDVYRRTKHIQFDDIWDATYSTDLSFRMACWGEGQMGEICPLSSTCSGELAMKAEYAVRAQVAIDVGGLFLWSKGARALAADFAQLIFDPPGPAPATALFEKGVAAAANTSTGWDAENVVSALLGIAKIVGSIQSAEEGSGSGLEDELIQKTVDHLLGMIERQGSDQGVNQTMVVEFNTANSIPFHLQSDKTYLFNLVASSILHTDGYGGESTGEANIDSAYVLAAVGRYYQCADKITPPAPGAYWDFYSASSSAPHSIPTLAHLVETFVFSELGASINVGTATGHYP